ncbi:MULTISPECIES: hypothetical protein [unclassified Microcoleus]|nr:MULTISPECIES: hypothetical protein [unclassified Microcoleus]
MIFWQREINTPVKRSYPDRIRPIDNLYRTTNKDSRTIAQNN